jgi:DNA-binding transcriptional ArsR family regulator
MASTGRDEEGAAALADIFGALSHPVRIRALLQFRGDAKLSASKLLDAIPDVGLGTLAYHVRQLADSGLLKPAGRIPRRGAIEHLYVLTPVGAKVATLLEELPGRLWRTASASGANAARPPP